MADPNYSSESSRHQQISSECHSDCQCRQCLHARRCVANWLDLFVEYEGSPSAYRWRPRWSDSFSCRPPIIIRIETTRSDSNWNSRSDHHQRLPNRIFSYLTRSWSCLLIIGSRRIPTSTPSNLHECHTSSRSVENSHRSRYGVDQHGDLWLSIARCCTTGHRNGRARAIAGSTSTNSRVRHVWQAGVRCLRKSLSAMERKRGKGFVKRIFGLSSLARINCWTD